MSRLLRHVRSQLVAYLALFIALGGTGYAAVSLPANSVGSRQLRRGAVGTTQLRNGAVTPAKLAGGSIAGYVRAYATVNGQGQLVAARPGARLIGWSETGPAPGGVIAFKGYMPSECFALGTAGGLGQQTVYASAALSMAGSTNSSVAVSLSAGADNGLPGPDVSVAVICR